MSSWNLLRLVYFIPYMFLYTSVRLVLIIIGHLVLPPLIAYGLYKQKKTGKWPWMKEQSFKKGSFYTGLPSLFYVWDNEVDTVLGPPEYKIRYPEWSDFKRAWMWSAVRNPTNNLRFTKLFGLIIDPNKIRYLSSKGPNYDVKKYYTAHEFFTLTWIEGTAFAGIRGYFKIPFTNLLIKFLFGYKVYPEDTYIFNKPEFESSRKISAGFGMQLKRTPPGEFTRKLL